MGGKAFTKHGTPIQRQRQGKAKTRQGKDKDENKDKTKTKMKTKTNIWGKGVVDRKASNQFPVNQLGR